MTPRNFALRVCGVACLSCRCAVASIGGFHVSRAGAPRRPGNIAGSIGLFCVVFRRPVRRISAACTCTRHPRRRGEKDCIEGILGGFENLSKFEGAIFADERLAIERAEKELQGWQTDYTAALDEVKAAQDAANAAHAAEDAASARTDDYAERAVARTHRNSKSADKRLKRAKVKLDAARVGVRGAKARYDQAIAAAEAKYKKLNPEAPRRTGMKCPPPGSGLYASLELGGGWWNNTITFGRDPSVNAGGFVGGGAFGFRMPVSGIPDSLVWPVGARVGVLGGSFNSSTVGYTVKTPLAFYGEAEFANPIFSSLAGRLIPHTVIYSSAGIAGVWQNYGWSMPGLGGNTNTVQFAFTTSIRAEWKITRTIDFYVQWRSFLATPQQFNLPGLATANGYSNMVTLGVQF